MDEIKRKQQVYFVNEMMIHNFKMRTLFLEANSFSTDLLFSFISYITSYSGRQV